MRHRVPGARRVGIAATACGLLLARPLVAQPEGARRDSAPVVVSGVVWAPVNVAVAGARVTLAPRPGDAATPASVITDDNGTFRFTAVRPGRVTFQVRRLGFASTSITLDVPSADGGPALLQVAPVTPQLATVVVNAPRVRSAMAQFEERRSRGFGRFITRAEIERRAPMRTSDLFRTVPGARMGRADLGTPSIRFRGSNCDPEFVLDGLVLGPTVFDVDAIAPGSIEGIEIYSGASTVPVEFKRSGVGSRSSCGMIVVWTRLGEPRRSRRKSPPPITAAGLAALVEAASVFTADQVDVAARPQGDLSALIPYPEGLRGADRVMASAVVEFVVDSAGAVEGATINFVSVPAPVFAAVLRASAADLRFTPALRKGVPVRQVVQLAVQFDPEAKRE